MSAREAALGIVYLRRSDGKQESSLAMQVNWAVGEARNIGIELDASEEQLKEMQRDGLIEHGGQYLDDAVTGADLARPGFLAMLKRVRSDRRVSHVFAFKRDRLGRPGNPIEMMAFERQITDYGVTVVFGDAIALPTRPGESDLVQSMQSLFAYHESGNFLRQHAERVLAVQQHLAKQGFRTGGRAPYGFSRVLVGPTGEIVEKLADRRHVRQPGHHVEIRVDDPQKIEIWISILELKLDGWGCKRIARRLNDLGIPSPDAGRSRRDQGVAHVVSGKWSPNAVANLCRNAAVIGMQDYGRRSEGAHRRLGADGPRPLGEGDRTIGGTARVIFNSAGVRISSHLKSPPQFDELNWRKIQAQMDERGKDQRGIRRAKDPAKYPLSCRVFDLTGGCGSVMYGTTVGNRSVLRCGRYMRTAGSECAQNTVDAEALLKYLLSLLVQRVAGIGNRDRLQQFLEVRARAERPTNDGASNRKLEALRAEVNRLSAEERVAERRMAVEQNDGRYQVLARQCEQIAVELAASKSQLATVERQVLPRRSTTAEQDVAAALSLLDDITRVADDPAARADIPRLLDQIGVRIGLNFGTVIPAKKREVQVLLGGIVAFGDAPLPVPIHGANNRANDVDSAPGGHSIDRTPAERIRDHDDSSTSAEGDGGHELPHVSHARRREGNSITKVNRGDKTRAELFRDAIRGLDATCHAMLCYLITRWFDTMASGYPRH